MQPGEHRRGFSFGLFFIRVDGRRHPGRVLAVAWLPLFAGELLDLSNHAVHRGICLVRDRSRNDHRGACLGASPTRTAVRTRPIQRSRRTRVAPDCQQTPHGNAGPLLRHDPFLRRDRLGNGFVDTPASLDCLPAATKVRLFGSRSSARWCGLEPWCWGWISSGSRSCYRNDLALGYDDCGSQASILYDTGLESARVVSLP